MSKDVVPIHGTDHCPGGPDPIPCLGEAESGFVYQAVPIDVAYLNRASLEVWYRLGDDYPAPLPVLNVANGTYEYSPTPTVPDSSVHNRDGTGTFKFFNNADSTTKHPIAEVPGGLAPGNADNGYLKLRGLYYNGDLISTSGWRTGINGHGSIPNERKGVWGGSSQPGVGAPMGLGWTVSIWLKWEEMTGAEAAALARIGADYAGYLWANRYRTFGGSPQYGAGHHLYVTQQTGRLGIYDQGSSGTAVGWTSPWSLVPGRWYHVAYTMRATTLTSQGASQTYRRRIYLDTSVVWEDVSTVVPSANDTGWRVGYGYASDLTYANYGKGGYDEFAVFTEDLEQQGISELYQGRVINEGDTWTEETINPVLLIPDGSITTPKLADAAITTPKLADGAVTSLKIEDGTILTADLADNAVTNPKMADNAVGTAELAAGAVTGPKLAGGAVGEANLANQAVTNVKLADNSVTNIKVIPGSLQASVLAGYPDDETLVLKGDGSWAVGGGEVGPAGPPGAAGETGPPGPPGTSAEEGEIVRAVSVIWNAPAPESLGVEELSIREVPYDYGVERTFDIQRVSFRAEDPATAGTTTVKVEKSPPGGAFTPTEVASLSLVAGDYDVVDPSGLGTIDSGDLLRITWMALGAGADNFSIHLEGAVVVTP